MKTTVENVLILAEPLKAMMEKSVSINLSVMLVKISNEVDIITKVFDGNKEALFREHGKETDKGLVIEGKEATEFITEKLNEYAQEEVELPIEPIPLSVLTESVPDLEPAILKGIWLIIQG